MDLAEESPGAGRVINVLHYYHARSRRCGNVPPPVGPFDVTASYNGWVRRPPLASRRVTNHRGKVFEEAAKACRRKPLIAQADAEAFDGIGNNTRIERFELLDLGGG